jgi:hypothetical protein
MNEREATSPSDVTRPVFYVDWNVISYLQDSSLLDYQHAIDVLCLKQILGLIDRSSLITPYSYAHLADIRQGPKDRHTHWLNHLESMSGGWKVVEMPEDRNKIGLCKITSVGEDFSHYDSEQTKSESREPAYEAVASLALEPVKAEILRQIDKYENNPNVEILRQAARVLTAQGMVAGLEAMRFNKVMRNRLRNQDGIRLKYPDAKTLIKDHPDQPFRKLVDQSISKSHLPWNTYDELDKAIPIIGTGGFLSPFMDRVNRLSTIAEMIGIGLEKLQKNTAFRGLVNDRSHLAFGLRCHYMVSEDSALLEKAVFIKNMIELPVVVLRVEGLNRLLLTQIAQYYVKNKSPGTSENPEEFTFGFYDSDGREIRTYVVKAG